MSKKKHQNKSEKQNKQHPPKTRKDIQQPKWSSETTLQNN